MTLDSLPEKVPILSGDHPNEFSRFCEGWIEKIDPDRRLWVNGFSVIISPITTNGARTDPWRWIPPMVELSIHPNWARSSSSQRSMAYTIITFGKPHEYSRPTGEGG